jgi:steroid 5-alpha reductase family enzyme
MCQVADCVVVYAALRVAASPRHRRERAPPTVVVAVVSPPTRVNMAAAFVNTLLADPTLAELQKQVLAVPLTPAGVTSNAAAATAALTAAFAAACWVGQVTTGYWSWVDRLWSIVPVLYAGTFALYHPSNARVVLMAALTLAWGVRLSLNFARKGGYSHEEDYRWPLIRSVFAKYGALGVVAREAFSLGFVAVYQHLLLWLIAGPQTFIASLAADGGALTARDYALAAAFVTLLVLETLTDEQQWAFQSRKYAMTPAERKKAGGDYARGFRTDGVFAVSRHLNFFCEQSMWCVAWRARPPATLPRC